MSGIVGRDEGAFAASLDQAPADGGLEVVVVRTEPIEQLEDRGVGLGPVLTMIVLQMSQAVAALGGAGGIEPLERALLMGVGAPSEVRDSDNVLALGDDRGQEWVFGY